MESLPLVAIGPFEEDQESADLEALADNLDDFADALGELLDALASMVLIDDDPPVEAPVILN